MFIHSIQYYILYFHSINTAMSATLVKPSRGSIVRQMEEKFNEMQTNLKMELNAQQFFCTTADIWSTRTRSFMGITIHYVSFILNYIRFDINIR